MKEWCIFTYMAGDNNLSPFGMKDIIEMEETGSSDQCDCLVEYDASGEAEPYYKDVTLRYKITEKDPKTGKALRAVVERLPETDSGDPETLTKSLKWMQQYSEANHNVVVLWNHGSGFRLDRADPTPVGERPRGGNNRPLFNHGGPDPSVRDVLTDDLTGSSQDTLDLIKALSEAGFSESKKIDILGFDACLMNLVEIAYDMSRYANFMVGSEELEPGEGWPYAQDLEILNRPGIDARALSKEFVGNYGKYYSGKQNQWPVTQSAIDLGAIGQLAKSIDRLGETLKGTLNKDYDVAMNLISKMREAVQMYAPSHDYDDYVDCGDWATLCKKNIEDNNIKEAADKVLNNLEHAVIANIFHGSQVEHSHGLTIWFPESQHKYKMHKEKYMALSMTKECKNWNEFLAAYHTERPGGLQIRR
jgi:hypothetical protein